MMGDVHLTLINSVRTRKECLYQERYDNNFRLFYPVCGSDCKEERHVYDANFDKLFPQCKAFTKSEATERMNKLPPDTTRKHLVTGLTKIDSHHVNASTITDRKMQSCTEKRHIYDDEKLKRVANVTEMTIYSDFNTNSLRGSVNSSTFYDRYPECKPKNFVDLGLIQSSSNEVVKRRRLVQRYSLCNIGSSGEYTKTANCSITTMISVSGTLKITGVADSNGAKPAIDGGWDGVPGSNTGVTLFRMGNGDELTIENMILTNGEVSIFRPFLILSITFVLFT
eukprot:g15376.t1